MSTEKPADGYKPQFSLDLWKASAARFNEIVEAFEKWRVSLGELPPLSLTDGWHHVNQQVAEQFLLRNPLDGNRPPSLATVQYYAAQQLRKDWPKTGQPLIFQDGKLKDGGQRTWSSYLSGSEFDTFIVASVPPEIPDVFAYYDNNRSRTPAMALATSGVNGLSSFVNAIVHIAQAMNAEAYSMQRVKRLPRLSPIEVLRLVRADDGFKDTAHIVAAEYQDAIKVVGAKRKDVCGYLGYRILAAYDEVTLEEFMLDLGGEESELPAYSPIRAFRAFMAKELKKETPYAKHIVLANLIATFNAWKTGEQLKRLNLTVADDFPEFLENVKVPEPETAEA